MLTTFTAFFNGISALATAGAKYLEYKIKYDPLTKIESLEDECEEIENQMQIYRASGTDSDNQLADGLRNKLIRKRNFIKYISSKFLADSSGDSSSDS